MQVQVKPWGNSHGIRFSKSLMRQAGIHPEDALDVQVDEDKIILTKCMPFRHRSLRERAEAYGGQLNLSSELEWDAPAGSEIW